MSDSQLRTEPDRPTEYNLCGTHVDNYTNDILVELIDTMMSVAMFHLDNFDRMADNSTLALLEFSRSLPEHEDYYDTERIRIQRMLDGAYTVKVKYETISGYLTPSDVHEIVPHVVSLTSDTTTEFDSFGDAAEAAAWLVATNSGVYTVVEN